MADSMVLTSKELTQNNTCPICRAPFIDAPEDEAGSEDQHTNDSEDEAELTALSLQNHILQLSESFGGQNRAAAIRQQVENSGIRVETLREILDTPMAREAMRNTRQMLHEFSQTQTYRDTMQAVHEFSRTQTYRDTIQYILDGQYEEGENNDQDMSEDENDIEDDYGDSDEDEDGDGDDNESADDKSDEDDMHDDFK